jgi:hypothetical protein
MDISNDIEAIELEYASIPKKLDKLLNRLRCLRRIGKASPDELKRIRRLELDLLELKDLFNHQEHLG